jgi:Baseplate J-like protein
MTQPLTEPRNRLVLVAKSDTVNGLDFVELQSVNATTLYVHFLNAVSVIPTAPATVLATITGGDRIQGIQVNAINNATDWSVDENGFPLLTLTVNGAGDFSNYTLTLTTNTPSPIGPTGTFVPLSTLDPMYCSATFSFKVLCPSDFDCAPKSDCCKPTESPLPAIDYLAKDFQSFKLALTDFSSQRYPSWQERSEADFGVMFMEALCAVADELSYLQDRTATESSLLNATQRRSLVSMARLVDYEPAPTLSASTMVQCNVVANTVPAGALITATTPDGSIIPFEIGNGLNDTTSYLVSPLWNDGIQPYWFDDSQQCLPCGSTSMWILGHGYGFENQIASGRFSLLIQTDLPGESIREVVTLTGSTELTDPIFLMNGQPTPVTYITWSAADALKRDHDLTQKRTHIAGNLLNATQGQRFTESFAIGTAPQGSIGMPIAVARYGPNGTDSQPNWILRYPLSRSNGSQGRLTWLPSSGGGGSAVDPDVAVPLPELIVSQILPEPASFSFATSLLNAAATEPAYTVDPAAWRVVATDEAGTPTQWEYDGDQSDTIRFGDGTFGAEPVEGDVFTVQYRIGLGAGGNVAPGAIQHVDPSASAWLSSVRNPFAVTKGADAETAQHIRRVAPQAFRATQFRAVTASDYEAAAESLPWVLKAGTSFRWTGSWLTVFTTVDPSASGTSGASATEANQEDLINLLNRRRLTGYESYAPPPTLVSIDLVITVCVQTGWLSSDVEAGVLSRLADAIQPDGTPGFFYADSFTFGTPLYRSNLEAAIQSVKGVKGALDIEYRQRGASAVFQTLPAELQFGTDEILRVANDPNYPERGTIRVIAEGGR